MREIVYGGANRSEIGMPTRCRSIVHAIETRYVSKIGKNQFDQMMPMTMCLF